MKFSEEESSDEGEDDDEARDDHRAAALVEAVARLLVSSLEVLLEALANALVGTALKADANVVPVVVAALALQTPLHAEEVIRARAGVVIQLEAGLVLALSDAELADSGRVDATKLAHAIGELRANIGIGLAGLAISAGRGALIVAIAAEGLAAIKVRVAACTRGNRERRYASALGSIAGLIRADQLRVALVVGVARLARSELGGALVVRITEEIGVAVAQAVATAAVRARAEALAFAGGGVAGEAADAATVLVVRIGRLAAVTSTVDVGESADVARIAGDAGIVGVVAGQGARAGLAEGRTALAIIVVATKARGAPREYVRAVTKATLLIFLLAHVGRVASDGDSPG